MKAADEMMSSKDWLAATSAIARTTSSAIPDSAWRIPLSRHLKLAAFVEGVDADTYFNNPNEDSDLLDNEEERGRGSPHPLHVAASQNILKLGRLILCGSNAAAIDPDVREGSGRTPLHWAAMTNRVSFMLLLLENDATVEAADCQYRSPLLCAAAFGATDAARLLLRWGADCQNPSRGGITPLHAAAAGGHADVVELLISAGADVHARTAMCCSPRHVAERRGHTDVVRILCLSRGSRSSSAATGEGHCGDAYDAEEEQREIFSQHKFDRADLLQRPLFR